MKLDRQKLFNALSYLVEINEADILKMDFSDLFDDKKDLTEEEKTTLHWCFERLNNVEIIQRVLREKELLNQKK